MKVNFGKINRILLIGGGRGLLNCCKILQKDFGCNPFIITSGRHAEAPVGDSTFRNLVSNVNADCLVTDRIDTPAVTDLVREDSLALSFGASWIFPPLFVGRFNGRLLNVHGARLPLDRGAGGFSWKILRGDRRGACCIHVVDDGIDSGDIVEYSEFLYPLHCRKPVDFYNHTLGMYLPFLKEFLAKVFGGNDFQLRKQDEAVSTYFPRLNTEKQGMIDWSWTLADIEKFVCAFDDPYPGAATYYGDLLVRLRDCFSVSADGPFHSFISGLVYRKHAGVTYIAAGEGGLAVRRVTDAAGNDCFARIKVGHRLHTPIEFLERAKVFHAAYGSCARVTSTPS